MKRNGHKLSMPKDGIITSDVWSTMKNTDRYEYLNNLKTTLKTMHLTKKSEKVEVVK